MKFLIFFVIMLAYICIGAIVAGVIDKYEDSGKEIGLWGIFAFFWPLLIFIAVFYYPATLCFKLGRLLFNFEQDTNEHNELE